MARRKQTRRKSRAAVRRRKYMVRRIVVLIIFLAVITGLTLLLIRVFSGDFCAGRHAGRKSNAACFADIHPGTHPYARPAAPGRAYGCAILRRNACGSRL